MPGQKSRQRGASVHTDSGPRRKGASVHTDSGPRRRGLLYTHTADPGPSLSSSAVSLMPCRLGSPRSSSPLRQSACRSLDASLFRQSACRSQVWRYSVVQVLRVFSCLGAEGIQLSRCAGSASRSAAVCLGKLRGASPYQAVITLLGA